MSPTRADATPSLPEGLLYQPDLITPAEERQLLEVLDGMELSQVVMHGQTARRTVRHFGYHYGYESWRLTAADPLPESLRWLRDRGAAFAGVAAAELVEALVTRYPPGAGIGWHRDAPMFGPTVVGVSLLSECRMRFREGPVGARHTLAIDLAPRSCYVISGAARSAWQHTIPGTKALRYSITFRTVRSAAGRRSS